MMHKRSQMEIMGLAVIVVLIVFGMLFAVKFILFKPDEGYRKDYTQTQLAANLLNTLLNTNTNCNDISVSELLQDASKYPSDNILCGSLRSKDYLNQTISFLLSNVSKELNKKYYYFKASVTTGDVVTAGMEYANMERERKTQFLQTDFGTMTITLDIYG